MAYQASPGRYACMEYRRCGNGGLKLPPISLGLWHNFGRNDSQKYRSILRTAFSGITHFDLANNYSPPPGAAEETFEKFFRSATTAYRKSERR